MKKWVEKLLVATFVVGFFLMIGFVGSLEMDDCTIPEFLISELVAFAMMGASIMIWNKL